MTVLFSDMTLTLGKTGFTVVVSCNFELAVHSCPLYCLQRVVTKLGYG